QATPDFAFVSAGHRYLSDRLLARCDEAGVGVLALVATEEERRHAAAIGLFETLPADSSWPDIEQSLGVRTVEKPHSGPVAGRGTVIAVWGPAGSPGRTTLAIAVAAELAAEGYSVALADV